MARGAAEPPITTCLRYGSLLPVDSRCCSSINQTVGTAALKVTRYLSSNSKIDGPSSLAPGITIAAPIIGEVKASPQQLAWNIGTTGRITSREETPMASAGAAIIECSTLERCE